MTRVALLAVLGLAACGTDAPIDPSDTRAVCAAQAATSPELRMLQRARPPASNVNDIANWEAEIASLRRQEENRCLVTRGVTRGGGVEPVRTR